MEECIKLQGGTKLKGRPHTSKHPIFAMAIFLKT
jgi:hypothetical protein